MEGYVGKKLFADFFQKLLGSCTQATTNVASTDLGILTWKFREYDIFVIFQVRVPRPVVLLLELNNRHPSVSKLLSSLLCWTLQHFQLGLKSPDSNWLAAEKWHQISDFVVMRLRNEEVFDKTPTRKKKNQCPFVISFPIILHKIARDASFLVQNIINLDLSLIAVDSPLFWLWCYHWDLLEFPEFLTRAKQVSKFWMTSSQRTGSIEFRKGAKDDAKWSVFES